LDKEFRLGRIMSKAKQPRTFLINPQEVNRQWFEIDATGKTLGRLATEIARILRGKHKPTYTPHVDCGDCVIVLNAEKVHVTGAKREQKLYRWHAGFIGNLHEMNFREMIARHPERVIETAVKGMLPKTNQARHQMKHLRVQKGEAHEYGAQQAIKISI
jgi:large subunit ribosomal protein L13